ncbi:3-keto-disaccharide hydrolase [Planctomicrobium sp. SH668]|uniref:3-keto-disaccharide hydrolase n=1 Tax=Planctomicrobium sp. SH668 TaxID=3448126 RepID=UPI003F5B6BF7
MNCIRRSCNLFSQALALTLLCSLISTARAEDGYQDLFNGQDLTGWDGNPEQWSVQDGILTGVSDGTMKYNQFLIWTGGELNDFELKIEFRFEGDNNSGVQYRSKRLNDQGDWVVGGYQADLHPAASYTAMLYEERGRGIIAERGQKVVIDQSGNKTVEALPGKFDPVDLSQWHELVITAKGTHITHALDGAVTIDLDDAQVPGNSAEGVLAIQLHAGPPSKVQIRSVRLKSLKPAVAE